MHTSKAVSAAVVFFLSLAFSGLEAQSNFASINATATVLAPITVTAGNDLAFGNVTPGVAKTVGVTAAGAGTFSVSGTASTPVSLTFTLPTNLNSGGNLLPIGSWTGHHNTTNAPTGGTNFTPSASATPATTSGSGNLYVFVGATVTPGFPQTAGSYTGSVQMTVVYE